MPFITPTYWNDDSKKTATSDIAVKNNYSFTEENENKVTAIETKGNDIIESILKNKVLPNEVELDPLYKLIALFLSNNLTFRGEIKNALNKNRENIIVALQALITPPRQERILHGRNQGHKPFIRHFFENWLMRLYIHT